MKRILLDENIPIGLGGLLTQYAVRHVRDQGWTGLSNGSLIMAAEQAGFDIMITADRSLRFQQNFDRRRLAVVVLNSNNWPLIRHNLDVIAAALRRAEAGTFQHAVFDVSPR